MENKMRQKCMFVPKKMKSNYTAKGDEYFLMYID
jgi:hypothetical protein